MESLYEQYQALISESEAKLRQINMNLAEATKNRDELIGHMLDAESKYKADPSPENEKELSEWIGLIRQYEEAIARGNKNADSAKQVILGAKEAQREIIADCEGFTTDTPIPEGAAVPEKKGARHTLSIVLFCVAAIFLIAWIPEIGSSSGLFVVAMVLLLAGVISLVKENSSALYEIRKTSQCISTKAAGVTFNNGDGSSRQQILEKASAIAESSARNYVTAQLRHYMYQGEDAFSIETAYGCIGNIPADVVFQVVDSFNEIKTVLVYPDNFTNERGRLVWFARVEVYY